MQIFLIMALTRKKKEEKDTGSSRSPQMSIGHVRKQSFLK
jgi:hypothetical protein